MGAMQIFPVRQTAKISGYTAHVPLLETIRFSIGSSMNYSWCSITMTHFSSVPSRSTHEMLTGSLEVSIAILPSTYIFHHPEQKLASGKKLKIKNFLPIYFYFLMMYLIILALIRNSSCFTYLTSKYSHNFQPLSYTSYTLNLPVRWVCLLYRLEH